MTDDTQVVTSLLDQIRELEEIMREAWLAIDVEDSEAIDADDLPGAITQLQVEREEAKKYATCMFQRAMRAEAVMAAIRIKIDSYQPQDDVS